MNFIVLASLIAALFFSLSIAENGIRGRIYKGHDAEEYQFKYIALLFTTRTKFLGLVSKVFLCGGAIIGPNWILTAAHCVDGIKKVDVGLGVLSINKIQVGYEVKKKDIIIHPDWDSHNTLNDIALIRIPRTEACDRIRFASLPFNYINVPHSMLIGMDIFVMGWGQMGEDQPMSYHLKWTEMAIITNEQCSQYYGTVTDDNLCGNTTEPYGAPCMGDSGAPIILGTTGQLIGIFSSSPYHGCDSGHPSYIMRVTSYLPWISKHTDIKS